MTSNAESNTKRPAPPVPRPSASIVLLSPTNQVLLLHRVQTSTSFASAHVFPGGNLSSFHGEDKPLVTSGVARHRDSEAYRLAAVRETFEESGILLARPRHGGDGRLLLQLSDEVRERGRKDVHGNRVRFVDWLRELGGVPDIENLIPFTRWVTPTTAPKRFTTQMYLYMLPLATSSTATSTFGTSGVPGAPLHEALIPLPTSDGGLEHTAATFDDATTWLARARVGDIVLFPPQLFLLTLVAEYTGGGERHGGDGVVVAVDYAAQRDTLLAFLRQCPTAGRPGAEPAAEEARHATAAVPWVEKMMSPVVLFRRRRDGRIVMGVDKPGPEVLAIRNAGGAMKDGDDDDDDTPRGGDWDRVVLVNFKKGVPRDVEVRWRVDVLREERDTEREESMRTTDGVKCKL